MKPTTQHSFPDAEVTSWVLSDDALKVRITKVYYKEQLHGPALLTFPLMRPARAMSYDKNTNTWRDESQIEPLKDICEFHHKMDKLYSLKGFGKESGGWIAVSVVSEQATILWGDAI